jgi:hypothetical protein
MPTGAGSNPLTQSTAGTWIARWTAGAALGQIVFGGTIRLMFAVALGALLGGAGVWLIQRHRTARVSRRRVTHPMHTGGRVRYSPLAPDAQWQQSDREHVER